MLYVPAVAFKPRSISHFAYPAIAHTRRKKPPNPYRDQASKSLKDLHRRKALRIQSAIQVLYDVSEEQSVFVRSLGYSLKMRVNLITLTLPSMQCHSDREIHNTCFLPFIRFLKSKFPSFAYVYRLETQENGNLHYHLVTNQFIHYLDLRVYWNKYVERLGYVSRSSSRDPNSTDVHKVKDVKDMAAYCAKYLSKKGEGDRRVISIRDWGCSVALTKFKIPVIECPDEVIKEECRAINRKLRSAKRFEWCYIQSITYDKIKNVAPVIASMYACALAVVKALVNAPPNGLFCVT